MRRRASTVGPWARGIWLTGLLLACEPEPPGGSSLPINDRAPGPGEVGGGTTGEEVPLEGSDPELEKSGDSGDTGGSEPPRPDDEVAARAHLDTGRKLTRNGRYRRAMAELELGLERAPHDPLLWSEHGWAAFRAGELETARESTEQALLFARTDRSRASMLYNLGRIAEKSGELDDSAGFYEQSLRYRPNDTVRKRLAKVEARIDARDR